MSEIVWLVLNAAQVILLVGCYVFLAGSAARRLYGMGYSKHFALLTALPVVNLALCFYLALTLQSKTDKR